MGYFVEAWRYVCISQFFLTSLAEALCWQKLTNCGLMRPYGDRDLGQDCLR